MKHPGRVPRWLLGWSVAQFGLACVLWVVDQAACESLKRMEPYSPQLHAWWHVLCGASCHWVIAWLAWIEVEAGQRGKSSPAPSLLRPPVVGALLPLVGPKRAA